jgi:hypothetical protein
MLVPDPSIQIIVPEERKKQEVIINDIIDNYTDYVDIEYLKKKI